MYKILRVGFLLIQTSVKEYYSKIKNLMVLTKFCTYIFKFLNFMKLFSRALRNDTYIEYIKKMLLTCFLLLLNFINHHV